MDGVNIDMSQIWMKSKNKQNIIVTIAANKCAAMLSRKGNMYVRMRG